MLALGNSGKRISDLLPRVFVRLVRFNGDDFMFGLPQLMKDVPVSKELVCAPRQVPFPAALIRPPSP